MRRIVLLLITMCFSGVAIAQLSKGGQPSGYKFYPVWEEAAPLYLMPAVDAAQLKAEDDERSYSEAGKGFRFGKALPLNLTPSNSGAWHTLPSGNRLWMLRIKSNAAFSLAVGFEQMNLPEGAKLFIYNKDRSVQYGAFTRDIKYVNQVLSTDILKGDEIMLEYEVPAASEGVVPFKVVRVTHDYRNLQNMMKSGTGFGSADYCHINVNCYSDLDNIKRSVVAIIATASGTVFTGTLVNTTDNSGIPYVITAYHCYKDNTDPSSWVFRFKWEASDCLPATAPPPIQSIPGATLRAAYAYTDLCLVELSQTPPSSYNAIFAGWDRRNIAPTTTTCISHPAGDLKRVAISYSPATQIYHLSGTMDCWKTGTWNVACTQGGSSGAAMLNQDLKVVGTLFGGPSECGMPASEMYDFFGRFFTSWNGGGTPQSRLKDWLDPKNTNATTVEYFDPNTDAALVDILSPTTTICDLNYRPKITVKNTGTLDLKSMNVDYIIDNNAPVTFAWSGLLIPGASTDITLPYFTTVPGNHDLKVYISAPNRQKDNTPNNDTMVAAFYAIDGTPISLPLSEGFESPVFPPRGWSVVNPDPSTQPWRRFVVNTEPGNSACVRKDNYNFDDKGTVDHLITPFMNFQAMADYLLTFKVAHARYDSSSIDRLQVFITTDCGDSWKKIYDKAGSDLATVPQDLKTPFSPKAGDWRTDSIRLNSYMSNPKVQIRFTSTSGYGNHIYLDNINLNQRNALPITDFVMVRDTFCAKKEISLQNMSVGADSYNWDIPGAIPSTSNQQNPVVIFDTPGVYTIGLTATNTVGSQLFKKKVIVMPPPQASIFRKNNSLYLNTNFYAYHWYKNGVLIPGATSNSLDMNSDGNYFVEVQTNYGCTAKSQVLVVSGVLEQDNSVIMLPNPAHDFVQLQNTRPDGNPVNIAIFNAVGQVVHQEAMDQDDKVIDLRSFATGVYNVRIVRGKISVNKKLTIK